MKVRELEEYDEDAVADWLTKIISLTKESLWFSTSFYPEFYNREDISTAFQDILNRDVSVKILLDSDVDESITEEVDWASPLLPNLDIRKASEDVPHWVLADNKHIRLEKEHEPGCQGGPNLIAMNIDRILADVYERQFWEWWRQSESIGITINEEEMIDYEESESSEIGSSRNRIL